MLDVDSYRQLTSVKKWLHLLRYDIDRADAVIFIGFSAADFHLAEVFFNTSGLRNKAFFINHPTADPDVDERATQEDFGQPLYIGREEFAAIVEEILRETPLQEPQLASFVRYQPSLPSPSVPPVSDIEDLLIWGIIKDEHLKRDWDIAKSDYHVLREDTQGIEEYLNTGGNIILLQGDICDGKTIAVSGAMNALSSGRPVFELRHSYADLLNEVTSIISAYPNAIIVVENCFSLREERLLGLVRQISASKAGLLLSARSISTEAESAKYRILREIPSFKDIRLKKIQPKEVDDLVILIDQIAGWKDFRALSLADRKRFIERDCDGVLPSVLLRLLSSNYVRAKYREEYNKIENMDAKDREMLLGAILIASIGIDAPVSFLSDVFERDFTSILERMKKSSSGLKILRTEGKVAKTIPSIGARNIIRHVIPVRETINANIHILEKLANNPRRSDFEKYIFSQLMRYSIIGSVIDDNSELNRFFDHISKISQFRQMPLFWLQWHMAMCAQTRWLKAEEYLVMGYKTADEYEKRNGIEYNRKQLEDRKAKFLAARANAESRTGPELFRDIKESLDIVGRLMREADLSHHPYETLLIISKLLKDRGDSITKHLYEIVISQLAEVSTRAEKRMNVVAEGYQRTHANDWLTQVQLIRADLTKR